MNNTAYAILEVLISKDTLGRPIHGKKAIALNVHKVIEVPTATGLGKFFDIIREMHIAGLVNLEHITCMEDIKENKGSIEITIEGFQRYYQELCCKLNYI